MRKSNTQIIVIVAVNNTCAIAFCEKIRIFNSLIWFVSPTLETPVSRIWILLLLLIAAAAFAEDSLTVAPARVADTMFVIPAGPVAGTFTPASRLVVADTVAGWAHIQVEGWVPVGAVMDRLTTQELAPAKQSTLSKLFGKKKSSAPAEQCQAITRKGTRCSRNAQPSTPYCWQHQKR